MSRPEGKRVSDYRYYWTHHEDLLAKRREARKHRTPEQRERQLQATRRYRARVRERIRRQRLADPNLKDALSTEQLAVQWGKSRENIERLARHGYIQGAFKLGRMWKFINPFRIASREAAAQARRERLVSRMSYQLWPVASKAPYYSGYI